MSLSLQLGLRLGLLSGGFTPASLFAAGEQGYWLDPSDFSTMFQDAAGTTPVTAVGQSVRRINDKSGRGNNFTQANVANAPILQQDANGNYFLLFDGTDDWLQSAATINPGAVDKAQVFAGARKLSDAVGGILVEASANANTSQGSFGVFAPDAAAPTYGFGLRGNGLAAARTATTFTAPITNVLSCQYDIAQASTATEISPRINGAVPTLADTGASAGGGNFLTYTHFIGRRGGTTLPFNGRLYQLITRYGANLTAAQITQTENYVAGETGVYTLDQLNRFATLDASGVSYNAYGAADENSNNYLVPKTVLAADGTPYSVL